MLQDNGNVTAYCQHYNHENIIVNVPLLIEAAFQNIGVTDSHEEDIKAATEQHNELRQTINSGEPEPLPAPTEQPETHPTVNIRPAKVKTKSKS